MVNFCVKFSCQFFHGLSCNVNFVIYLGDSLTNFVQERLLEAGYKRNISESSTGSFWPSYILGDTLRIVFQNLLLESNDEILKCSERVWRILVQVFSLSPFVDL